MEHVQQMSSHLGQALAAVVDHNRDIFEEVRGAGLLRGLKCRPPNTEVCAAFRARGLLTPTAGDNVVRVVPPLIVQPEHIRGDRRLVFIGQSAEQQQAKQQASQETVGDVAAPEPGF